MKISRKCATGGCAVKIWRNAAVGDTGENRKTLLPEVTQRKSVEIPLTAIIAIVAK